MQSLDLSGIDVWCTANGFERGPEGQPVWDRLWESLELVRPEVEEGPGLMDTRKRFAVECVDALEDWSECLLWIPRWAGSAADASVAGETQTINEALEQDKGAIGHLFERGERRALIDFVRLVLVNRWDAHLLPSSGGGKTGLRAFCSHDGWVEFFRDGRLAARRQPGPA